jgi:hypothetical protein
MMRVEATVRMLARAGLVAIALSMPAAAGAQDPAPPPGAPALPPGGQISAGQIQRLFDAYIVLQAQDALSLSEEQYGRFVTRLKSLQEARRQHQQARNRILGELRKLVNAQNPAAEETVAGRVRALRDEDERAAAEIRKAHDALDETLDVRQQARFRLFEERMEQQKLDLLLRARQNARAQRGRGKS